MFRASGYQSSFGAAAGAVVPETGMPLGLSSVVGCSSVVVLAIVLVFLIGLILNNLLARKCCKLTRVAKVA